MYNRLLELLHKLPQDVQDKVTELAKADADYFCKKYDLTLPDQTDTAYRYYLSKWTRDAVYQSVMVGSGTLEGFMAIHEIKDYFTKKFDWVLNDYIRTRYIDTESVREPLHEVIT